MNSQPPFVVHVGDMLDVLPTLAADSVDAVVSDPPYGLSFMGKHWDHGVPGLDFWREVFRVAKPGAHLVAFGGTRTYHRLTCAIEDAGFEIRDCLSWLYGTGFPKSHNGPWGGTALKPAWEPIILARKPLVGTVAANVAQYGTGGINVDGCRIETDEVIANHSRSATAAISKGKYGNSRAQETHQTEGQRLGRWPANVVLDDEAAAVLDAQGGASRFFYTAKASRREREAGLDGLQERTKRILNGGIPSAVNSDPLGMSGGGDRMARNHHPTVKPIALMRWLCRLVTPPGGLVLDPFTGSGSTGAAALLEGFPFVGVEREPEYAEIARARIAYWAAVGHEPDEAADVSPEPAEPATGHPEPQSESVAVATDGQLPLL